MTTINFRIDEKTKEESEKILSELGIGMSSALVIFLKAVIRNNGIPFRLEIPNSETEKAMKEADDIIAKKRKAKEYRSVDELRKDLKV